MKKGAVILKRRVVLFAQLVAFGHNPSVTGTKFNNPTIEILSLSASRGTGLGVRSGGIKLVLAHI